MSNAASRYAVGVIHHGSYPELPGCVGAIRAQTVGPRWIRILDADNEPARLERALRTRPEIERASIENRGYAYGANRLIERAFGDAGCEYLLLLNPDVVLEPGFAAAMLGALEADPEAALAGGRLIRRDGKTLDSAGILLGRNRRPRDRASDQRDVGQYAEPEAVFGASGAALWLRLSAARDLAVEGEIFDEDFFLYHEETDLAWRAALFGWRVLYVPGARAQHERGWKRGTRFAIPPAIRRHSFKNHSLQMIKNDRLGEWLRDLPVILGWELLRLSFALLRDRAVLGAYRDTARLARRVLRKRRLIQARARGRVRFGRS
ncbi:MAG: glycosyltransferase family 2 protein [Myxococcota bacterium]|nr:glycosyltransferase family 2 protein [Myxococcota bacterium]